MRRRRMIVGLVIAGTLVTAAFSGRVALVSRAGSMALGATYLGDSAMRRQQSLEDCGVAALHMLFDTYGRAFPMGDSLRHVVHTRRQGLSFAEMAALSQRNGLTATGYIMDVGALARTRLPAIAHLTTHFIVVDRVLAGLDSLEIRDPQFGRMRLPASRFLREWTGRVLVFTESALGESPPGRVSRDAGRDGE
jgi:ABC-type bacteriocin/lantibiotic exporter with double-glycine peptidase domain